jgi:hypothetical protein
MSIDHVAHGLIGQFFDFSDYLTRVGSIMPRINDDHVRIVDDEHRIAISASSRNAAYGAIHTWSQLFKFVKIPRNSFDLVVG